MLKFSLLQIYRTFGKLIVEKIYNKINKLKNLNFENLKKKKNSKT